MTRSKNSTGKPLADRATAGGESSAKKGGYGDPPAEFRWKPGQSGNPRGRPRKAKPVPFSKRLNPFRDMFLEEMGRLVDVKEGGQRIQIEAGRAIIRSVTISAMQGDLRKQKLALQLASAAEQSSKAEKAEDVRFVTYYKAKWDPVFASAAKAGKPEPEQLPHPDHVNIDLTTAEITFTGPVTPAEKHQWDHLKFQLRENAKLLDEMISAASAKPRSRAASNLVALVQRHLIALEKQVPPGWNWREELGWEGDYAKELMES